MLNAFLTPLRAGLRYLSPLRPQSATDEVRGADDNLTTPPRAAKHDGYLNFRQESYAVMIDTDGATFIINNSATCILSNDRSLFVGSLKPAGTCVQTTSGFSSPQFVGTIRLSFVTDEGQIVSYDIDDAIYDPGTGFNILVVVSKVEDSSFRGRGPLELVSSPHLVLIKPPRCDLPQRLGTYPAGLVPSRTIL